MDLDNRTMLPTTTEPISLDWTTGTRSETGSLPTADDVNRRLAAIEVTEIDDRLVPYLAAAAAELALLTDIPWRFSVDDPPVALLRLIARATISRPDVGGPHTARLFEQLS